MSLVVISLTLWSVPAAHAKVVTLGPPALHATSGQLACELTCTPGYTAAVAAPASTAVAPAAGVVTRWAVIGSGTVSLRVLEPAPGGAWRGEGTSATATKLEGADNVTELPVEAGDVIGVDVLRNNTEVDYDSVASASYLDLGEPPIAEGSTRTPLTESGEVQLNAQVELNPVITALSPASGSTAGGNTVTITGKYLDSVVNVLFGSTPAVHFSVDLAGEHIIATAPASSAGTVDVHASTLHTTSDPVAADRYTFIAPAPTPSAPMSPGGSGALVVSGFRESVSSWRRGRSLPHIASAPVGTSFAFSLNEPASLGLTFTRVVPGRRVGGKCVAPSRQNGGKARCKREVNAGAIAVSGHAGLNSVRFQGRLSSTKKLALGSYRARLTRRGSHGVETLTRALSFSIAG
jgi:IPT/TIG domain